MLQIRDLSKQYVTGNLVQTALDHVSLSFRDNEFAAILGPSGAGKTTLLNIIGGLDHYDSGDLVINQMSTKQYKSRDWDSYRNHTIGFVFQSYNLIPHQTILSNVELALTIGGSRKRERQIRAKAALEQVGLGDQIHKRPSQLSGGQMQRVAIARALVNQPDILLADEPTGALDSETSVQVMELLKDVAKERLVIMVTHNESLAEHYATRIISLKDGAIIRDSDPFEPDQKKITEHKNMGRSSIKLPTAFALSLNNLATKKGRTILTAFASSIGIIGIALILSLSNGIYDYIGRIQKETMTSYPITINEQSVDFNRMMGNKTMEGTVKNKKAHEKGLVYSNSSSLAMMNQLTSSLTKNNLTEFKNYLDDKQSEIHRYIGENGIKYSYDVGFDVYSKNQDGAIIDTSTNAFQAAEQEQTNSLSSPLSQFKESVMDMAPQGDKMYAKTFEELLVGSNQQQVSNVVKNSYDMVYGKWPQKYNEVVIVLDEKNEIPTTALYALGLIPTKQYNRIMKEIESGKALKQEEFHYSYEDLLKRKFYLIPSCDHYIKQKNGTYKNVKGDNLYLESMLDDAVKLQVTGIIRPIKDAKNATLTGVVGYTNALTHYLIEYANQSEIVKEQEANPDVNILNGMKFSPKDDAAKVSDAKRYIKNMGISEKANLCSQLASLMLGNLPAELKRLTSLDEVQLANMADTYLAMADDDIFLLLYNNYISTGNYDNNMSAFGYVSLDAPSSISIYADTFEAKEAITNSIQKYNERAKATDRITYTDFIAMITKSVTKMVTAVTYVLIAFVGVSLIVSSIMIGIITYISVLERTKEIGILRAMGASKRNISQVFNAETFIIGTLSGVLGIIVSKLILIPSNLFMHSLLERTDVNASLPFGNAICLILLSILLTLIGGWIPSKKAAKRDPVIALRSE
ncbi:ABC-type antimicrobial peptide transport system, ATPase component [Lachnospiraceae bacterium KM106-2]|nr:ABC-type antimicrobial peptide transport system, ATPase component [Lachnospiraceae bacterium KM106-2]